MSFTCDISPELYETSEPVARKQHKCCECAAPITPGEKHLHIVGKWVGDFSTYRQHLDCAQACMMIRDRSDGECIPFGALKEWWGEVFNQNDEALAAIAVLMKRIEEREPIA